MYVNVFYYWRRFIEMRGGSSLGPSGLWVFSVLIACCASEPRHKPQSLPSAFKALATERHRVDGCPNQSQRTLVSEEQVQLKILGLWNFKKGTNTNISEINWCGWNSSKEITLILRLNMLRSSPNGLFLANPLRSKHWSLIGEGQ